MSIITIRYKYLEGKKNDGPGVTKNAQDTVTYDTSLKKIWAIGRSCKPKGRYMEQQTGGHKLARCRHTPVKGKTGADAIFLETQQLPDGLTQEMLPDLEKAIDEYYASVIG